MANVVKIVQGIAKGVSSISRASAAREARLTARVKPGKPKGLKTTTGQQRVPVSDKEAREVSRTIAQRPNNAGRARAVSKPDNTVGVGRSETKEMQKERPVTLRKVDPKLLKAKAKAEAGIKAEQRKINTNTKRPAKPIVKNPVPAKRGVNVKRQGATQTPDNRDYKYEPNADEGNGKPSVYEFPTIESREPQSRASRGKNIEKATSVLKDKKADRMVSAATTGGRGFNKPGPREVSKSDVLAVLRKQWKDASPAKRIILQRQAAKVKIKMSDIAPKKVASVKPRGRGK